MQWLAHLAERGVITIEGDDRVGFLQGLVSNDIAAARAGHAVWAALLSPQGKWLADFFVFADGDTLRLDCERTQVPMLIQRLSRYRLRTKVAITADADTRVYVAWGNQPEGAGPEVTGPEVTGLEVAGPEVAGPEVAGVAAPDPRLPNFAWRILSTTDLPANTAFAEWDRYRMTAGLPDGSRDMETDRSVLLEAGYDELSGVSWTKGCYMGQELTARTKYRGLVKRRLVPVAIEGPLPASGSPVLRDGVEVGVMRSGLDGLGLAILRLDRLGDSLTCEQARLLPRIPSWMRIPETALPQV